MLYVPDAQRIASSATASPQQSPLRWASSSQPQKTQQLPTDPFPIRRPSWDERNSRPTLPANVGRGPPQHPAAVVLTPGAPPPKARITVTPAAPSPPLGKQLSNTLTPAAKQLSGDLSPAHPVAPPPNRSPPKPPSASVLAACSRIANRVTSPDEEASADTASIHTVLVNPPPSAMVKVDVTTSCSDLLAQQSDSASQQQELGSPERLQAKMEVRRHLVDQQAANSHPEPLLAEAASGKEATAAGVNLLQGSSSPGDKARSALSPRTDMPPKGQQEKHAHADLVTRFNSEVDIVRTESEKFVERLASADLIGKRAETETIVTPRMDRAKRMISERKRTHHEAQDCFRRHFQESKEAPEEELTSPSNTPSVWERLPLDNDSLPKEQQVLETSARSVASATTGTEVGSLMSSPNSSRSQTFSTEWLLPLSALVPSRSVLKLGEQRPPKVESETSRSQQRVSVRNSSRDSFAGADHHVISTPANQVHSAALNIIGSPFLWVNRSDADIKRELDALLSNLDNLSRECNDLFFTSLMEANDGDIDYGTMSSEQLHNLTQRLVNHLGSRDASVLERLRLTYQEVFKLCLDKDGINADEFRDYITAVLTHICQELEARQKGLPPSREDIVYAGLLQKTRSTLDLMKSQQTLDYWSSSECLTPQVDHTEDEHSQPFQMMLTSLRERLTPTAGPSATDSESKAPSQCSTGSRCSSQISPKTQEAKEAAKQSERKAESAFEQTLRRAWEVLDKDRQLELVAIEDRLREEEARLSVVYRRQRADLRINSRQEVARLLLPCSPANRLHASGEEPPGYAELISSAPSDNEA